MSIDVPIAAHKSNLGPHPFVHNLASRMATHVHERSTLPIWLYQAVKNQLMISLIKSRPPNGMKSHLFFHVSISFSFLVLLIIWLRVLHGWCSTFFAMACKISAWMIIITIIIIIADVCNELVTKGTMGHLDQWFSVVRSFHWWVYAWI